MGEPLPQDRSQERAGMTARDVKDRLGPLASALAVTAGWRRSSWNTAVHRGQELTPEQRAAYKAALSDHIEQARKVRKAL